MADKIKIGLAVLFGIAAIAFFYMMLIEDAISLWRSIFS